MIMIKSVFSTILLVTFVLCCNAQNNINNDSKLKIHNVFDNIKIGIPEVIKRVETNAELTEKMGFIYFKDEAETLDITFRRMDYMDLEQLKVMMDMMSTNMYNGTIIRSEVVKNVNSTLIYVTNIEGQWNGSGEKIGMFRYYFNVGQDSYNLLMKYPKADINSSKELLNKMVNSIEVTL